MSTVFKGIHDTETWLLLWLGFTYSLLCSTICLSIQKTSSLYSEHAYCSNRLSTMITSVSPQAVESREVLWFGLLSSAVLHRGCLIEASLRNFPKQSTKQQTVGSDNYWKRCGVALKKWASALIQMSYACSFSVYWPQEQLSSVSGKGYLDQIYSSNSGYKGPTSLLVLYGKGSPKHIVTLKSVFRVLLLCWLLTWILPIVHLSVTRGCCASSWFISWINVSNYWVSSTVNRQVFTYHYDITFDYTM